MQQHAAVNSAQRGCCCLTQDGLCQLQPSSRIPWRAAQRISAQYTHSHSKPALGEVYPLSQDEREAFYRRHTDPWQCAESCRLASAPRSPQSSCTAKDLWPHGACSRQEALACSVCLQCSSSAGRARDSCPESAQVQRECLSRCCAICDFLAAQSVQAVCCKNTLSHCYYVLPSACFSRMPVHIKSNRHFHWQNACNSTVPRTCSS